MTNDQALLASMENNTVIGIFVAVLVVVYLILLFSKDSRAKKYMICEDEIVDEKDYIHKDELIEKLTKYYWPSEKVFVYNYEAKKEERFNSIKEWLEQRVFNQENK